MDNTAAISEDQRQFLASLSDAQLRSRVRSYSPGSPAANPAKAAAAQAELDRRADKAEGDTVLTEPADRFHVEIRHQPGGEWTHIHTPEWETTPSKETAREYAGRVEADHPGSAVRIIHTRARKVTNLVGGGSTTVDTGTAVLPDGSPAASVVRKMYLASLSSPEAARYALFAEVYRHAGDLLGMRHNSSAEAVKTVDPLCERVIALLFATAGVADDGTDDTPAPMATVGLAREVMARAVDISDIRAVGPVDDERRLAGLVDTTPDAD